MIRSFSNRGTADVYDGLEPHFEGGWLTRLPKNRSPTPPGEILRFEFLDPLELTQRDLADALDVSYQTVNGIVNGRVGISAEMALKLARFLGTTPDLWLNMQKDVDLYRALHSRVTRAALRRIKPATPTVAAART